MDFHTKVEIDRIVLNKKMNKPTYAEGVVEKATALEDWLDGETVEDMLGISRRTLQYYRTRRLFPYLKIGNKIYYKRADIEAMMEGEYGRQMAAIGREGEKARRREGQEGGER